MKSKTAFGKSFRVLMLIAIVVGLFAFVPAALAGDGITIDFDSGKGGNTDTYRENGVKVKSTSGGTVRVNNYDGDSDKELRGGQYKFKASSGQRFTVKKIRIVEYDGDSKFTSSKGDATKANQPDPYTKEFSGKKWKKIKSFEWTNTENSTIDDVEITLYDEDGEEIEEPVLPDCGRSPYKPWADQPGPHKFERKFWQPCRNVSGDENDTLYHGLFLPEAIEAGLQLGE